MMYAWRVKMTKLFLQISKGSFFILIYLILFCIGFVIKTWNSLGFASARFKYAWYFVKYVYSNDTLAKHKKNMCHMYFWQVLPTLSDTFLIVPLRIFVFSTFFFFFALQLPLSNKRFTARSSHKGTEDNEWDEEGTVGEEEGVYPGFCR